LSLPLDPSRKTGYKLCSFTCSLYRYAKALYDVTEYLVELEAEAETEDVEA
jgi:hypothetical protein